MSFMERLHSALILKTPMHHPNEAHIVEQPQREFLEAIRRGDNTEVEARILEGFDLDHAECTHTPPLLFAIMQERFEIIQTLLNYGADVNVRDHQQRTPLHMAVKMRQNETIQLLMRYGADAKAKNAEGVSAMELAYRLESKTAAKLLKQTPSMLKEPGSLFEAAKRGDLLSIARADKRSDRLFERNRDGQSLLHLAVAGNNIRLVAYLLNKGLDIDATDSLGNTSLCIAAYQNGLETVLRYLIRRHATLDHRNDKHHSALMIAMGRGYAEYVDILLDAGAEVQTSDGLETPLTLCHDAIERYPEEADTFRRIESKLMVKGAHPDPFINDLQWTPLFQTVTRPQSSKVKAHLDLLLSLGANVNHRDKNGRTALMLSCSTGRGETAQKLLKNYANPDLLDVYGWSALMFAVYYNHVRIVHMLLEHGADVNATSDKGLTALKIAHQYNRTLLAELLIDYGAIAEDENRE
jgi:ankyrin repeat protein